LLEQIDGTPEFPSGLCQHPRKIRRRGEKRNRTCGLNAAARSCGEKEGSKFGGRRGDILTGRRDREAGGLFTPATTLSDPTGRSHAGSNNDQKRRFTITTRGSRGGRTITKTVFLRGRYHGPGIQLSFGRVNHETKPLIRNTAADQALQVTVRCETAQSRGLKKAVIESGEAPSGQVAQPRPGSHQAFRLCISHARSAQSERNNGAGRKPAAPGSPLPDPRL